MPKEIRFQTKQDIALGQIRSLVNQEVPRGVVLADAAYGNANGFRAGARIHGSVLRGWHPVLNHALEAAIEAGILIEPGQRWGLHNLRHSISSWLVNNAHVKAKTEQWLLRHANVKTTLNLYTHEDSDETRTAQGAFLQAVGMGSQLVQ